MCSKRKISTIALVFALAGCSYTAVAQASDSLLASIRGSGEVKVAMGSAPPWMFVSPSGEGKGYNLEVMQAVFKRMGLPALKPVLTAWNAQIPSLLAKQADMIAPGLQMTEARCQTVIYSAPVALSRLALYFKAGNPKHLSGLAQIKDNPALKLAVIPGSAERAEALRQGVKPEQLLEVPDNEARVAAVTAGRADAFYAIEGIVRDLEQKGLGTVIDTQAPRQAYGVIFRKEDAGLRNDFNKHLNELRDSGEMQRMFIEVKRELGISETDALASWALVAKAKKASDILPSCE